MAQTVKVLGSGPLAGLTFYGTYHGIRFGHVVLLLDEPLELHGERTLRAAFCLATGALFVPQLSCQADTLHVDPLDVPRLDEMVVTHSV